MTALLEMREIVRRFGAVTANDGIDLDVSEGEILGLLGENGSGKSTLMKVLFGMIPPDAGSIVFRGRALSGHRPADAMAAGIGRDVDALPIGGRSGLGFASALAPVGSWLIALRLSGFG